MKKTILLILVGFFCALGLAACGQFSSNDPKFEKNSFYQFSYEGKSYTILNKTISENDIVSKKASFLKTIVVDKSNQRVVEKSNENTITLAYSGLYNSNNGLAISINSSYYRVILNSDLQSNDELLNINSIQNEDNSLGKEVGIDSSDCRVITYGDRKYQISDDEVSEESLEDFKGIIADSRIFNPSTGQIIPKSELNKIDNTGKISQSGIETWDYGEVYSVERKSDQAAIAVEINNSYRLAYYIE
ncbi:NisI/SpaI family lantibiotic immunity lipoprotein [Streptococcus equinus]|uniref:NisI/SpaI family lantibiotic immunity lipoprotein n=1 Tax=Streptococcus equinus TaxID=1335 RepID=UPI000401C0DB|nr:NisI/SpaI family lantibiotic immunity lipoprotein [Streptococcus equinus]SCW31511.1 hypothetical protein SAMN02910449_0421 [Streptococcus equinus]SEK27312.1 hypothetical protein SAMN04487838_0433 [Streptococcus equinus]